jgi:hypothetical protein
MFSHLLLDITGSIVSFFRLFSVFHHELRARVVHGSFPACLICWGPLHMASGRSVGRLVKGVAGPYLRHVFVIGPSVGAQVVVGIAVLRVFVLAAVCVPAGRLGQADTAPVLSLRSQALAAPVPHVSRH